MSTEDWVTVGNNKKKRESKKPSYQSWSDQTRNLNIIKKFEKETKSLSVDKNRKLVVADKEPKPVAVKPIVVDKEKKEVVIPPSAPVGLDKPNYLNDTWVLWYHDMKNPDWTVKGYEQLFEFNTVEDFWILYNNITDLTNGMYYLMRKDVPPIWDDPKNINGGAWTFKVDKRDLNKVWEDLSCYCVGETICKRPETIVGLSISPKIRYATVRVWTTDTEQSVGHFDTLTKESQSASVINFSEARFTPNKQASI